MAQTQHKINNAAFDISFGSVSDALENELTIAPFIKKRLMPVVEDVFDSHTDMDTVITINKLEIDLGEILRDDFPYGMEARLREMLDIALRDKINYLKLVSSSAEGEIITHQQSDFQIMEQFLTKGVISGYQDFSLNRVLPAVLDSDADALMALIKENDKTGNIKKRMVRQFSGEILEKIVWMSAPSAASEIIDSINILHSLLIKANVLNLRSRDMGIVLWDLVFDYLFNNSINEFDLKEFINKILSDFARLKNIDKAKLQKLLDKYSTDENSAISSVLFDVLKEQKLKENTDNHQEHKQDEYITENRFELLKRIFMDVIIHRTGSDLGVSWENLLTDFSAEIRNIILSYGKEVRVRKRIVEIFTEMQIRQLVHLIEPEESDFVDAFVERKEIFQQVENINKTNPAVFKKQLWEFVLTYLLVDKGSRFNRKSFAKSVIRQLADQYNMRYSDLLTSIRELLLLTEDKSQLKTEIINILEELEHETGIEVGLRQSPDKKTLKYFIGYDLYESFLFYIRYGTVPENKFRRADIKDVSNLINLLIKEFPEHIESFLIELKARPELISRVRNRLSPKQFKTLLYGVLSLLSFDKTSYLDLTKTIELYLVKVVDKQKYYADILDFLVIDKKVDFEEIIKMNSQENVTGVTPETERPKAYDKYAFFEYLRKEFIQALVYKSRSEFSLIWKKYIADIPELIKKIVIGFGQKPENRKRIINVYTEEQIKELIFLVEPENSQFINDFIETSGNFQKVNKIKSSSKSIFREQVLEFVLSYLFVDRGSIFNKKEFTRSIIRGLAAQYNMTYTELLTSLRFIIGELETESSLKDEINYMLLEFELEPGVIDRIELEVQEKLYEDLKFFLQYGVVRWEQQGKNVTESVLILFRRLQGDYPEFIRLLIKDLQKQPEDIINMVNNLSEELVYAFMFMVGSVYSHDGTDGYTQFIKALAKSSKKAVDRDKYYADILNNIINGRAVDLEEIVNQKFSEKRLLEFLRRDKWSQKELQDYFDYMFLHEPEKLHDFLIKNLKDKKVFTRLIKLLPDRLLVRVLYLMFPSSFSRLQNYIEIFRKSYLAISKEKHDQKNLTIWAAVFSCLAETGSAELNDKLFLRYVLKQLAEKSGRKEQEFISLMKEQITEGVRPVIKPEQMAVIAEIRKLIEKETVPETAGHKKEESINALKEPEEKEFEEEIYLLNAGMVVAAPFLPMLFDRLDLTEKQQFKNEGVAERCVHLLQYLVNEKVETPEYQLVLNKVLCGVKPGVPIVGGIEITDKEIETIESLVMSMINNWKGIGNTSVKGFRESFLQREGTLRLKNNVWTLEVESRAFDMLLDSIPWSFSTVKFPWMDRVVYVKWR